MLVLTKRNIDIRLKMYCKWGKCPSDSFVLFKPCNAYRSVVINVKFNVLYRHLLTMHVHCKTIEVQRYCTCKGF